MVIANASAIPSLLVGPLGQLVVPMVTLQPYALTAFAPTLNMGPAGTGTLSGLAEGGSIAQVGGAHLDVFASIVDSLVNGSPALPGNNTITVGNGNNMIFGNNGVIAPAAETGIDAIDTALSGASEALLSLSADLGVLSYAQDAVAHANGLGSSSVVSIGNNTIKAGNGRNMIFGSGGEVLVPNATLDLPQGTDYATSVLKFASRLVDFQQAVGDLADSSVVALQTAIGQFATPAAAGIHAVPLATLSIGNNSITVGNGTNVVVGENGTVTFDGDHGESDDDAITNWVTGYDPCVVDAVQRSAEQIVEVGNERVDAYLESAFPEPSRTLQSNLQRQANLLFGEDSGYTINEGANTIVAGNGDNALYCDDAALDVSLDTNPAHGIPSYWVQGDESDHGDYLHGDYGHNEPAVLDAGVGEEGAINQIVEGAIHGGDISTERYGHFEGNDAGLVIGHGDGGGDHVTHARIDVDVASNALASFLNPVLTSVETTLLNAVTVSQKGPNEWVPTGTYASLQLAPVLTTTSATVASRDAVLLQGLVSAASPAPVTTYELIDTSHSGARLLVNGCFVDATQPIFLSAKNFLTALLVTGSGTTDALSIRATDGFGYGPWQSFAISSALASPPAITVPATAAGQTTSSEQAIKPFLGLTVSDANGGGAIDTLTITLSGAGGTLTGSGLSVWKGVYTLSGTAAALTANLDALVFTPNKGAPNSQTATTFTLTDMSSGYATAVANNTTSVINVDPAVAPTIAGTKAAQATTSERQVRPFASTTIADPNLGGTDTLTISLGGAGGTLSGNGLTGVNGVYTLTGTAAAITANLEALVFTPNKGASNTQSTTTFALRDVSSVFPSPATDAATSVIDTDPAVAPTVAGGRAGQMTTSENTVTPFTGVTVTDLNVNATDVLTITLGGASGRLSGSGLTGGNGVYTLGRHDDRHQCLPRRSGVPAQRGNPERPGNHHLHAERHEQRLCSALSQHGDLGGEQRPGGGPDHHRHDSQPIDDVEAPVALFSGVTIVDANLGATDMLTITLGGGGGILSGKGLSVLRSGVYALSGTAASITSALDALTFTPNKGAPNSPAVTTVALSTTSSAFAAPANAMITIVDNDPVAPVIAGTRRQARRRPPRFRSSCSPV